MAVIHWNSEMYGELNEENMSQMMKGQGYAVTKYVYPPGTYFPFHSHEEDKMDGVLSGRFRINMGEESWVLEAGDCIKIPRDAVHCAEVIGDEAVVSLDGVKVWTHPAMVKD